MKTYKQTILRCPTLSTYWEWFIFIMSSGRKFISQWTVRYEHIHAVCLYIYIYIYIYIEREREREREREIKTMTAYILQPMQ